MPDPKHDPSRKHATQKLRRDLVTAPTRAALADLPDIDDAVVDLIDQAPVASIEDEYGDSFGQELDNAIEAALGNEAEAPIALDADADDPIALDDVLEEEPIALGDDAAVLDEDSLRIDLDLEPHGAAMSAGGAAALVDSAPASEALPAEGAPADDHPGFDRRGFLRPYIEALDQALAASVAADDDVDFVFNFAGQDVRIDPWARGIAGEVLAAEEPANDLAFRIVESLALEAKIKEDLARYRIATQLQVPKIEGEGEVPTEERTEVVRVKAPAHVQAEIVRDAALARALLTELQKIIDASVVHGKMGLAKSLNQFKPPLHHALNDLRELLDAAEVQEVDALAQALLDVPADAELPQIDPRKRRRRRTSTEGNVTVYEKTAIESRPDGKRIRRMVGALATLVILWAALLIPRLLREDMRAFTTADFSQLRGVQSVVARPPSLYVTLDGNVWRSLDERAKRQLVDEIAFDIGRAGYSGARFATANGVTVAQWLRARGTEMIAPPEEGKTRHQ